MTFDPRSAELHLGILNKRVEDAKTGMRTCEAKLTMDDPEKLGIDIETEQLNLKKLQQDYETASSMLKDYSDKVLELTPLQDE